jgi:hypothetical protein
MAAVHPDTIDGDEGHRTPAGVPVDSSRRVPVVRRRTWQGWVSAVPGFAWLLLIYFPVAKLLGNPYAVLEVPLPFIGVWKLSWAVTVLGLAPIFIVPELVRLSQPGVNQMDQVFAIAGVFIVQLILVVVAFTTAKMPLFKTYEGIFLMAANGVQIWAAYKINANSLVRTFAPAPVTN